MIMMMGLIMINDVDADDDNDDDSTLKTIT